MEPNALLAALGLGPSAATRPATGGWDTAIWRVELDGRAYALRLFRAEQARAAAYEALAMRTAAAAGLPVPDVRAEGSWEGRPVALIDWCQGRPLADELIAHPWRVWSLGLAAGATLARIHALPLSDELRAGSRPWVEMCGPDESALQARIRLLAGREVLLHLDYHLLNILTDGRRVTGVIDWMNSRLGDPRADVARMITILRLAPSPPGIPAPAVELLRRLHALALRRGYSAAAGPLEGMPAFLRLGGRPHAARPHAKARHTGRAADSGFPRPYRALDCSLEAPGWYDGHLTSGCPLDC